MYISEASSLHRIFVLVDAVAGIQESDKLLMDVLTDQTKPFNIVLTKADRLKKVTLVKPKVDEVIQ